MKLVILSLLFSVNAFAQVEVPMSPNRFSLKDAVTLNVSIQFEHYASNQYHPVLWVEHIWEPFNDQRIKAFDMFLDEQMLIKEKKKLFLYDDETEEKILFARQKGFFIFKHWKVVDEFKFTIDEEWDGRKNYYSVRLDYLGD